ncbi:MAG TPA: hypothetical protein VFW80_05065 [Gaiellaceae bacterium]|nr:hypothetical protein [Gaiellaceae bacterium]
MSSQTRSGPTGWAVFAGSVLAIAGAFNIIYGLAAIFRDQVVSTTGGQVIVWDVTRWGWILLVFGGLQLAAGMALFGGAGWARWTAVVLAGLNAVANIGFITVYPFWTALIVALDIIVIYQLTARWHAVEPEYYTNYDAATAGASAARDQMTRMRTGL